MDLSLLNKIGSGSFGQVYLGKINQTGQLVVIKIVPNLTKNRVKIEREIKIPQLLSGHKNIASVIESMVIGDKVYIISEYISGGINLAQWQIPDRRTRDGFLVIIDVMYQLAEAYHHIHSKGIVHRDIKPENILMKGNIPIIIDWDLSCINLPNSQLPCQGKVGTPNYVAPEIWTGKFKYDQLDLTDIYSLGVVFYYLVTGRNFPFDGSDLDEFSQNVLLGEPIPFDSGNDTLNKMILAMLALRPDDRISLVEVKDILQGLIKSI